MKNLLIAFLVVVAVGVSFAFMRSPKEPSEVLFLRGYVWIGNATVNSIKIYRGTAPVEIIELPKVKSKDAFDESVNKIMETVNKFTAQGYQVVSSTEFGGGASVILDFTLSK